MLSLQSLFNIHITLIIFTVYDTLSLLPAMIAGKNACSNFSAYHRSESTARTIATACVDRLACHEWFGQLIKRDVDGRVSINHEKIGRSFLTRDAMFGII